MAVIKPFKAMRFTEKAGAAQSLVCPPYDIISEAKREEFLRTNEHNIIRLELPRDGRDPYKIAGDTLNKWLDKGVLAIDGEDAVYLYEEEFSHGDSVLKVKGMTCRVRLEAFSNGVVLPHEETLSKAKTDRFNLMCAAKTNLSSIYSLYFDTENKTRPMLEELTNGKPDVEIKADGVTHRLWAATGAEAIARIQDIMSDKKIYIADGHHRYETALNYRKHLIEQGVDVGEDHPANYIMMHLVNMENEGLVVFPTHRVVRGLKQFDADRLLSDCGQYFDVKPCQRPEEELSRLAGENKKAFVLLTKNGKKLLILKDTDVMRELLPEKSQAYRELDVTILHTLILERLLGIDAENMANQKNLIYTRDLPEAFAEVESGEADCVFIINPTKVSEIAAVAGANEKMPQKSTYFYPKLITGLAMNPLFDK